MQTNSADTRAQLLRDVPVSTRDAIERIVRHGKRHRFSKNRLRDGDRSCPIGLFFTNEQVAWLEQLPWDLGASYAQAPVCYLPDVIGEDNFHAITGLEIRQAVAIQTLLVERGQAALMRALEDVLDGTSARLGECNGFVELDAPSPYRPR